MQEDYDTCLLVQCVPISGDKYCTWVVCGYSLSNGLASVCT